MNIKLHTPKSLKTGSGMSTLKQLLMSIVATSISIILTFGTAYFVDKNKKEKEKREMVMMIMYDMQETLRQVEENDSCLINFIRLQTDILANPETFDDKLFDLGMFIPFLHFNSTPENIFRSNIETINTISNIAFVENVSSFYDKRKHYKEWVIDRFLKETDGKLLCYDSLATFNTVEFYTHNHILHNTMLREFEVCKLQMNVTEEELQATTEENAKWYKAIDDISSKEKDEQDMQEFFKLRDHINQAIKEGKEKRNQKK